MLAEKFNGEAYRRFLGREPLWRDFHGWIKSEAFLTEVMEARLSRRDCGKARR